jgi:hypothetical protein
MIVRVVAAGLATDSIPSDSRTGGASPFETSHPSFIAISAIVFVMIGGGVVAVQSA